MAMFDSLFIRLTSRRVGRDRFGNTYWEARRRRDFYGRPMRRVIYPGAPDPTTVPPEWWGWMHHTTEKPLPALPALAASMDALRDKILV